ncbi:ectoine/hydroxyectoine ABC transporter permease subunit EhuC [Paenibacillus sp. 1001270B_150601_E10]|uniref:ectoine/hydroxyectoine ABC transporter permease subunit EhuC n=1 Tax=Paenibacillus sp. 1001270B_150601_E10 TaxID=2787079 RepID=UPI002B4C22ED|nr:ectoine/hydroxyectoine ABC transporter permease subunit EhuC [Paenibacillus sp. 1001270B_150601_E10]
MISLQLSFAEAKMNIPWLDWLPLLGEGTLITIKVALLSIAVALCLSAIAGLGSTSSITIVRFASRTYIELFRACSLLVLLFWVYFALPFVGVELSKLWAGVLAIGLNIGAYGAEIVRSSILAVPKGQYEAALALNLTSTERTWKIIIPQAVVRMIPPMSNLLIELLKSTSLVYFITLSDLTYEAMIIRNNYYSYTPYIFGLLLGIYFVLSSSISITMRILERKLTAWR